MKLLELYREKIRGAISGLDRIRFRGTLRWLAHDLGINTFLGTKGILLKDFTDWARQITEKLRAACARRAEALGIETVYLNSSGQAKDLLARQIAGEQGIGQGPICNLSVLETCFVPRVKGNKATGQLELRTVPSKCLHLYHYFDHPDYGFGHVRLQTWAPYTISLCLNGRHWLERQLQKRGIKYVKEDNGFPWIEDMAAAQRLLDRQLQTNWSRLLGGLVRGMCPGLSRILPLSADYYWSADETEWATDILFHRAADLEALYPRLLHYGLQVSDSPSVMKYLGKRNVGSSGRIRGGAPAEVMTDYRRFYEGLRIKHWVNQNSVKLYNKSGSILRIETTINQTREFKVFRHPDDDPHRPASWQRMRKGVRDLHRRCQVSQQCNARYAEALTAAEMNETLKEVLAPACHPVRREGKRYRGLNPWKEEDYRLLMFLVKGENVLNGFRNKYLRTWLYPASVRMTKEQQKKYSGRTTRRIKLLRVHGLIKKVARENRYMLTTKGQTFVQALKTASDIDIKALMEKAA
jgi:hypothetical protein